jgi:hypothetical protein
MPKSAQPRFRAVLRLNRRTASGIPQHGCRLVRLGRSQNCALFHFCAAIGLRDAGTSILIVRNDTNLAVSASSCRA